MHRIRTCSAAACTLQDEGALAKAASEHTSDYCGIESDRCEERDEIATPEAPWSHQDQVRDGQQ